MEMANRITVTNVKFEYNVVPTENTTQTASLVEITNSQLITFDKCTFDYNIFPAGIIKASFNPNFILYDNFLTVDVHLLLKGTTFTKNLINVKADGNAVVAVVTTFPVNIKLTKDDSLNPCTFEYNHSHVKANVGLYIKTADNTAVFTGNNGVAAGTWGDHPGSDSAVTIDPTYATLEGVLFRNNWGGSVLIIEGVGTELTLYGWSTINLTDTHFDSNGGYGFS